MTPPLFLLDDLPAPAELPGGNEPGGSDPGGSEPGGSEPGGGELVLGGPEGHHAARVQRVTVGETVLVGDGAGTVLTCTVRHVEGDAVRLGIDTRTVTPVPTPRLVLVQALPKGDRGELTVQTCTELGVDEIVPWAAQRCVTQWSGERGVRALDKWRRTAREAAKQSRRARVPRVGQLASTAAVAVLCAGVGAGAGAGAALVLHEEASGPLATVDLPASDTPGDIVVIVGPEGGITPAEQAAFASAGAGSVRLGAEVLRTSTAGAAALAVLSVRTGRWG